MVVKTGEAQWSPLQGSLLFWCCWPFHLFMWLTFNLNVQNEKIRPTFIMSYPMKTCLVSLRHTGGFAFLFGGPTSWETYFWLSMHLFSTSVTIHSIGEYSWHDLLYTITFFNKWVALYGFLGGHPGLSVYMFLHVISPHSFLFELDRVKLHNVNRSHA